MFYFILFAFALAYMACMSSYMRLVFKYFWEEYKFRRMIRRCKNRKQRFDVALEEALAELRKKDKDVR